MAAEEWANQLRALREKEGLTRDVLALRAGVAAATVKAYELGTRSPSRELLSSLLDALKADSLTRSEVLQKAGFAADGRSPAFRAEDQWFTFDSAVAHMEASPLPAHLNNESMELIAANALMQRVFEVDFNRELGGPFDRSFVAMLTHDRVTQRLANWDEAVSTVLEIVKGHYGGDASIMAANNPYFAAAIEHLLSGDPAYVQRFLAIWAVATPRPRKIRFTYPIVWKHSEAGTMRFHCLVNPANPLGSFTFNDWAPVDATTWEALEALKGRDDGMRTFASREFVA